MKSTAAVFFCLLGSLDTRAAEPPAIAPASHRYNVRLLRTPAPPQEQLPGLGLAGHDFICAAEWDPRGAFETAYLVRGGKVAATYTIPYKDERNQTLEFADIHLLANGNFLYAHRTGAAEITADKKLVWSYRAPKGTEVHSVQPLGLDRVFLCQNGFPAKAMIINIRTNQIEMEHELPTAPKPADPAKVTNSMHTQFRHVRMTKAGTYLLPQLNLNRIVEYDQNWKLIFSVEAPAVWTAVRVDNGNTLFSGNHHSYVREVNSTGEIVWEISKDDLPGISLYQIQEVSRLPNGNTIICNCCEPLPRSDWDKVVQFLEVTPDKKVVWALHQCRDPDLSLSSVMQIVDSNRADNGDFQR
jgi:hypothetical protein